MAITPVSAHRMMKVSERLDFLLACRFCALRNADQRVYVATEGTLAQHVRSDDIDLAEQISRTPGKFDQLMSVSDIDAEIARLQAELLTLVRS